jgi:DNA-binding MarR family transcriptional regulator
MAHAEESLNLSRAGLGDSDFRVLEVLLHKGPLPVNTIGPKVWLTPGSISVAVDRLEKKALVKRKNTDGRRVRLVELMAKDFSGARDRDGRGRPRPLKTGAADLAAAP